MQALVISTYGNPDVLHVVDRPDPAPEPGEVLVRVLGAPLQVADLALRQGLLSDVMPDPALPMTVGWELAGTVEAIGTGVSVFAPGDRVVGMSRHFFTNIGTHAQLVALPEQNLAAVPLGLDLVEVSTLPIALTAVQSLDLLNITTGTTILVTGAAGTVGRFAVRLAHLRGAHVLASASPGDQKMLTELGADVVLDRFQDLNTQIRSQLPDGVDTLLDCAVLGETALAAVKDHGKAVALLLPTPGPRRGIEPVTVFVEPNGHKLGELVSAVADGNIKLPVLGTYPLEQAAEAHRRLATGGLRGRLVFTPTL